MAEKPDQRASKETFEKASEESWWRCLSPACQCAYQKKECEEPGVCPYCKGTAYDSEPWDVSLLNNPHFPNIPQSGQPYAHRIVS